MSRNDRIALLISMLAVVVTYMVTDLIFERLPHIEDEMAYVWQAQVMAKGRLTLPSPDEPKSYLVPFIVDHNGLRFGKYPPGWPAMLTLGMYFGIPYLVNPLLAGLGVWLTYRLGKRLFNELIGILASVLTLSSPFFLMNSGSFLSHPFGLVLSLGFVIAWLDAFVDGAGRERGVSPWLATITAAGTLGLLGVTRPLTAVAVGFPFGLHGIYLFVRGDAGRRHPALRLRLFVLGGIVIALAALVFVWQFAVTGDPFLNPYTLWWPYDKVGFGPGTGRNKLGHTLYQARINTRHSIQVGNGDLFGWGTLSWIFLPFGLLAVLVDAFRRRRISSLLVVSIFPSLLVIYLAYWIGSSLFGPRYYYEGLFCLTLVSAVGVAWLAGWRMTDDGPFSSSGLVSDKDPLRTVEKRFKSIWEVCRTRLISQGVQLDRLSSVGFQKARALATFFTLALLLFVNVYFYLPMRLGGMRGLYGVQRSYLEPFLTPQAARLAPALIIVHPVKGWIEYGNMIALEDPFMTSPFVFIMARNPEADQRAAAYLPDRKVYHYYVDEPYTFYTAPRPAR